VNGQWRLIGVGDIEFDDAHNAVTVTAEEKINDFGRQLPNYEELLSQVHDCCIKKTKKRTMIHLVAPIVSKQGGKRTLWENFGTIAQQIGKPIEHLKSFMNCELITTTNMNEKQQLVLYGIFKSSQFESLIRQYVKNYCKCAECGCCDTLLQEDTNADIVLCKYCGRSVTLPKNKR
jgi:translation initiation factor 2 beta subunit (eIF-2beta)/eIF-5